MIKKSIVSRILAWALSLALVLGLATIPAFGSSEEEGGGISVFAAQIKTGPEYNLHFDMRPVFFGYF